MSWHDYVIGKFMWEVAIPFGILFSIWIVIMIYLAITILVIPPIKKFFKRL